MTRTGSKTIIAELTRTKADVEALLHKEIAKNSQLEAELATAYRQAELDIGVGRLQAKALAAAHAERDAAQAAFERAAIAEGEAIVARDAAQARADKAEAEAAVMRDRLESIADGDGGCSSKYGPGCDGQCQWTARGGLDGTAGRALLEELQRLREEAKK